MKFVIAKNALLLGLQRVQNVVEHRTTMPILSNALIRTEGEAISLAATDLEVGIQSLLPAQIIEPGGITVKARSLLDIVRELPETDISFEAKDPSHVIIKAKKTVFNILGMPAEDFPEIHGFSSMENSQQVRMNGTAVLAMLDKTLYAASTDDSRYHLNGVFFETVQETSDAAPPSLMVASDAATPQIPHNGGGEGALRQFRMVATDAHRLALVDNHEALFDDNAWRLFKEGVIVPRKGLHELRRILAEAKEDFFITIKGRMLLIKQETVFVSMRLIEGKYADYRRIIPEGETVGVKLDKEMFLASLKRIALMSSDKSRSITMALEPGTLQLSSQNPELGDAREELAVEYEGSSLKIGFNSRYLMDALSSIEGENVFFEIRDNHNPGVIRAADGTSHTSVVMPMRI